MSNSLRVLWVATKSPWPPVDGGRLVMALTIEALRDLGHLVTVVAPVPWGSPEANRAPEASGSAAATATSDLHAIAAQPKPYLTSLLRSFVSRQPLSLERHTYRSVQAAVSVLLEKGNYDVVHVEQLQALRQVTASRGVTQPPTVLRCQNVESDLWKASASGRGLVQRSLFAQQAKAMERAETRAFERVQATVTLTEEDAQRLAAITGIQANTVFAPFKNPLPSGSARLPGDPALVLFGSAGWHPNQEARSWFLDQAWPEVLGENPRASLHAFGGAKPESDTSWTYHPAPQESAQVFAPGSILIVPLRVGSGVRMKILEAWARGVPVITTTVGARGLKLENDNLLIANTAEEFAAAVKRLGEPGRYQQAVEAGRRTLDHHHSPTAIAGQLVKVYRSL